MFNIIKKTILCVFVVLFSMTLNVKKSQATMWIIDDNYSLSYNVTGSTLQLSFILKNYKNGWMSIVFHEFIYPGDTIVAWYDQDQNKGFCWDAYNPGIPTLPSFPSPLQDNDPEMIIPGAVATENQNNVRLVSATVENGVTTITCERALNTADAFDFQITRGNRFNVLAAYNENTVFIDLYGTAQAFWTKTSGGYWEL